MTLRTGKFSPIKTFTTIVLSTALLSGCATTGDIERLESKIDIMLAETNRSSLQQIFGAQTAEISQQLKVMDQSQVQRFESLQHEYVKGSMSIEEVRGKMLRVLGNDDRIVATQRGIYVRDHAGQKIKAISNNSKLTETQLLNTAELPSGIAENSTLNKFSWGIGKFGEDIVLFPWELTMSTFTKEIVENTARRTAEEFIKMGGDEKWNRPVYIELVVDESDKTNVITKGNEDEVFVTTKTIN